MSEIIDPPVRLLAAFYARFPDYAPDYVIQAPDREMWALAAKTGGHEMVLVSPDAEAHITIDHQSAKNRRTVMNRPLPVWARYPAGVLVVLGESGVDIGGLAVALAGDEVAGPRYDFALGMAFAALCLEAAGLAYTPAQIHEIVERVRRDFVG